MGRHLQSIASAVVLITVACLGRPDGPVASRSECEPYSSTLVGDQFDQGPCVLESSRVDGDDWTLSAGRDDRPRRGSTGDGPCITMYVSTSADAMGPGWCDLPEARLIGERVSRTLGSTVNIAWGPVNAGSIHQIRIDFAEGSAFVITPKPTPWSEFDYWFTTFPAERRPTALVALDASGAEVAREDVSGRPPATGKAPWDPPILGESQAIEAAVRLASLGRPELGEAGHIRNPRARLLTLEEWEDRFTESRSNRDRSFPIWAVRMEGEWPQGGRTPPESQRNYTHGVNLLDARSGEEIGSTLGWEPVPLETAVGLDPSTYARYPLRVSVSQAQAIAAFPVSEPRYLPPGFSLEGVTLDLAHPLQGALSYSWMPNQTAILLYVDRQGNTFQVAESRFGQPQLIAGAEPFDLRGMEAWRGRTEGATWSAGQPRTRVKNR